MSLTQAAELWRSTLTTAGYPATPGDTYTVPASQSDRTLYYVTSAGVAIANSDSPAFEAASTDVAVLCLANSGPQVWIYVVNDSTSVIQRGATCMRKAAATTRAVLVGGAINPARIVGVAQHDLPDVSGCWILREGVGEVLADGSVTADSAIEPAAAGAVTDCAATIAALGVSSETDAGTTLVTAQLYCRG